MNTTTRPTHALHLVHNPLADTLAHKPFVKGGDVEVYVTLEIAKIRPGHTHGFVEIDRHGNGECIDKTGCGATAWSAWWVKEDVYGTGTRTWVEEMESMMRADHDTHTAALIAESMRISIERDLMLESTAHLEPVLAVVAHLDFDMPARTERRKGLPVPPMRMGELVSLEERRSRKTR